MDPIKLRKSLLGKLKVIGKGINMERNARDFYSNAARRMDNLEAKKMFEWLARFEVGHKRRLEAKRDEILKDPVFSGEKPSDLGGFSLSEVDDSQKLPPDPSEIDILKIAVANEKRAYTFYQKKITFTDDIELVEMFEQMANEEDRHIKILSDQIEHLTINNLWKDFNEPEEVK